MLQTYSQRLSVEQRVFQIHAPSAAEGLPVLKPCTYLGISQIIGTIFGVVSILGSPYFEKFPFGGSRGLSKKVNNGDNWGCFMCYWGYKYTY